MERKGLKANPARLLGKRIRELRKKKGLTQEELGEKSGISYKYLGSIERGLENPSFKHLTKIARVLGADLPELFRFEHLESDRAKVMKAIQTVISRMSDTDLRLAYKILITLNQ